jgi:hypothetical protein
VIRARIFVVWLFSASIAAPPASRGADSPDRTDAAEPLHRATSASRQFVGYAADPLLPHAMCLFADRAKQQWLARLGAADNWRDPIVLVIREPAASQRSEPEIFLEVFRTDLHLKYQITCFIPPPLDKSKLLSTVVEALCAEWAHRAQWVPKTAPFVSAQIPAWLVHGLSQSIGGRTERLLRVISRSVSAGRPQAAAELLATTGLPADNLDRQLFEAKAWLFVEGLLALPEGAKKLQRYLIELGKRKPATDAFWAVYGGDFAQPVALEKWWGLQLARRASVRVAETMTGEATAARLDEILRAELRSVPSGRGKPKEVQATVETLWPYYEQTWFKNLLAEKLTELEALRSQAHPRFQPVITSYSRALRLLLEEKLNQFWRTLATAKSQRKRIENETIEITVYLDRAERTYAQQDPVTLFGDYFEMLDKFQTLEQQRRSPISDYLERFDH